MKLGIITSPDEKGFQYVKGFGLDAAEFCINTGTDAKALDAAKHKALSEQYGVQVASIGRWGADRLCEGGKFNEAEHQQDLALIDLCAALGTPVFVCGCNEVAGMEFTENAKHAAAYFKTLVAYGKGKGVEIAVYNCDWNNIIYNKRGWDIVLPMVPELGLKYDPSHCVNRDGDILQEMFEYGSDIKHFHLKGTVRSGGENIPDPPAGLDNLPWPAIMAVLYTYNYQGVLSIEPHSSVWSSGPMGDWGVRFTIETMRKLIM